MKIYLINIVLMFIFVGLTIQHGYLIEPAARSSAWLVDSRFPVNYDHMQMFCGGFSVQWNNNGGKCSICGENFAEPKMYEKGGPYYRGYSIKTYKRGQTIDVHVIITANHLGWVEFRICNIDNWSSDATHECLDRTLLKSVNGETRFSIPRGLRDFKTQLVLPSNLVCNQCVFQWKYNTGNSWGTDPITGQGCLGCGSQEQFYGCSDITITDDGYITLPKQNSTQPLTTPYLATTVVSPTTPYKPTPISQISDNKCPNGDGFYPDVSTGCQKFYICVHSGTAYQFVYYFTCPSGTIFDRKINVCNFQNQVLCA